MKTITIVTFPSRHIINTICIPFEVIQVKQFTTYASITRPFFHKITTLSKKYCVILKNVYKKICHPIFSSIFSQSFNNFRFQSRRTSTVPIILHILQKIKSKNIQNVVKIVSFSVTLKFFQIILYFLLTTSDKCHTIRL